MQIYLAFQLGNWGAENVKYYYPYIDKSKTKVLKDGLESCKILNLNYKDIYSKTFTSYKPICHNKIFYSDYESASSLYRIEAFLNLGLEDPILYANTKEPVSWELVKNHFLTYHQ